ncbi:hypothetical protein [Sphingobacterium chuzhouense]|uniref:HTH cro/C1-type domain-containing protein n=1 Tax=Sphingobacterium chuzhouense TaxID=1742264 RepID=A0ABR7XNQ2_9SPHI|nr:hypothetical protein [Sphingobacterium chuzhouense]MBD1420806.1 hypothetical protein [Sphingobacterium chuzhouense]
MIGFFDRLDAYMVFKNLNDNRLTLDTGLSNGIIGKARRRGSLSQDNIAKILSTYCDLDANWLFTGEGEMLKQTQKDGQLTADKFLDFKELAEARKEIILLKDEKIARLQEDIKRLEEKLSNLKMELKDEI